MYVITVEGKFSAAHSIKDHPGPCANMHGHNYRVKVTVESEKLDDLGLALDFHDLKEITKNATDQFDHKNLNELEFFSYQNPTSENIARVLFNKIDEQLPVYVKLRDVTVYESDGCSVTYYETVREPQPI